MLMQQPSERDREARLFELAMAIVEPGERAAFLDHACAGDPALRARLEDLLGAHARSGDFLGGETAAPSPRPDALPLPSDALPTLAEPAEAAVGQTLGLYKLLEKVGEGGCGVVYVAEQTVPVRRRVALKVIKLGMDTRAVVARFEAERQALAMMDHPNIAKVLDAGTTNTRRPYFVMELVRGIKITDYCDREKLGTQERLDLFIKVCQAIQHAHQKGIIHRDIKPSNILVTLHDGVPVPKVIDFGIAKAKEGRLTDATVYTAFAPVHRHAGLHESGAGGDERAGHRHPQRHLQPGRAALRTAHGKTPFDPKELMASGIDAMRRTIREKEPVRPSTKLATLPDEDLTTTAKRRGSDPPKLIHLLKGDLDWIVMKCLEKDRTRRYETANGLAMDLKRHLANEPVLARPPSTLYRLPKLVRRHKLAACAAAAVVVALLVAAGAGVAARRSYLTKNRPPEAERWEALEKALMASRTGNFEDASRAITEAELGGLSVADVHMLRGQLAMNRPGLRRSPPRIGAGRQAGAPKHHRPGFPDSTGVEFWPRRQPAGVGDTLRSHQPLDPGHRRGLLFPRPGGAILRPCARPQRLSGPRHAAAALGNGPSLSRADSQRGRDPHRKNRRCGTGARRRPDRERLVSRPSRGTGL